MAEDDGDRERLTVAVAQCIHAVIKANDALVLHFLDRRPGRHDEASKLLAELFRRNVVSPEYSKIREVLLRATSQKAKYDYQGAAVSLSEAKKWIRDAETFVGAVKEILES